MRILAVFNCSSAIENLKVLQKNKHIIVTSSNCEQALDMLKASIFDMVLCQAIFSASPHAEIDSPASGSSTLAENCDSEWTASDFLKAIRIFSDIPFVCCQTAPRADDGVSFDSAFIANLALAGGQGFINDETFYSNRMASAIEKCMGTAVGGECKVGSLYPQLIEPDP